MRTAVTALAMVGCSAAVGVSDAAAAGVPAHVKRGAVYVSELRAPIAGEGQAYLLMLFKTNRKSDVVQVISIAIEKIPLACTGGDALFGTESFAGPETEAQSAVASTGHFGYKAYFPMSAVSFQVAGRVAGGGARATGTITITDPAASFPWGTKTGCTTPTGPLAWSTRLQWRKFGI
jgi:hypothetical protein